MDQATSRGFTLEKTKGLSYTKKREVVLHITVYEYDKYVAAQLSKINAAAQEQATLGMTIEEILEEKRGLYMQISERYDRLKILQEMENKIQPF